MVEYRTEHSAKRQRTSGCRVANLPDYNPVVTNSVTVDVTLTNQMRNGENVDVGELMKRTFPRRRQEVVGVGLRRGLSMAAIKHRYPALFSLEQVGNCL